MPNNRRGFGGEEYLFGEDENGVYWESIRIHNWPTSPDLVPVGALWRSGTGLKVVAPSDTELLSNPGFEAGTLTGWTVDGSITTLLSTTVDTFKEGAQSLKATFPSVGDYVRQSVSLTSGKRYVFSCWAYPTAGVVMVSVKNATSGQIMNVASTADLNEWAYLEFEFVAASTASHHVRLGNTIISNTVAYFDDVKLREVLIT